MRSHGRETLTPPKDVGEEDDEGGGGVLVVVGRQVVTKLLCGNLFSIAESSLIGFLFDWQTAPLNLTQTCLITRFGADIL